MRRGAPRSNTFVKLISNFSTTHCCRGLTGQPAFRNAGNTNLALRRNGFSHWHENSCFQCYVNAGRSITTKLSSALRACAAMKTKCFLIRADRRRFFGRITRRGRSSAVAGFSGNKTNKHEGIRECHMLRSGNGEFRHVGANEENIDETRQYDDLIFEQGRRPKTPMVTDLTIVRLRRINSRDRWRTSIGRFHAALSCRSARSR